jgi:protein-S-isoprenylcysteine O-methyltransferase Ste14
MGYRLFYDRVMLAEEQFLRERFGAEYDTWAERTPALWPFTRGWRARFVLPDLPFSLRTVARREYPSLLSFGVTMVAVQTAVHWAATGSARLGWPWIALAGGVVLTASVLRFLNHRTKALSAEGR